MNHPDVWARARVVARDGTQIGDWSIQRTESPDMGSVDEVARLQLLATRTGGQLVFDEMSEELRALLRLAGLLADCGDP